MTTPPDVYRGCAIPPEVYEIGFGWDPGPEVERLLFLAREQGVEPNNALELGCGAGRLLSALRERVPTVCGIELSDAMAERARRVADVEIITGDMSNFSLGRTFDLIYTSANTIRHVLEIHAIANMWRCISAHLNEGGVFIADLELGLDLERERVRKPTYWTISRDGESVRVGWNVARPPNDSERTSEIEFSFEGRGERLNGMWRERFILRSYEAREFVAFAEAAPLIQLAGVYEIRDPHLIETSPEKAAGRHMVVLKKHPGLRTRGASKRHA